jgi:hypothetical protein
MQDVSRCAQPLVIALQWTASQICSTGGGPCALPFVWYHRLELISVADVPERHTPCDGNMSTGMKGVTFPEPYANKVPVRDRLEAGAAASTAGVLQVYSALHSRRLNLEEGTLRRSPELRCVYWIKLMLHTTVQAAQVTIRYLGS